MEPEREGRFFIRSRVLKNMTLSFLSSIIVQYFFGINWQSSNIAVRFFIITLLKIQLWWYFYWAPKLSWPAFKKLWKRFFKLMNNDISLLAVYKKILNMWACIISGIYRRKIYYVMRHEMNRNAGYFRFHGVHILLFH